MSYAAAMNSQNRVIRLEIERLYRRYIELMDTREKPGALSSVAFFEDWLKPDPEFIHVLKNFFYQGREDDCDNRLNLYINRAAKALGVLKRACIRHIKTGRGYETYLFYLADCKMEYDFALHLQEEAPCENHEKRLAVAYKACLIAEKFLLPEDSDFFHFLPRQADRETDE